MNSLKKYKIIYFTNCENGFYNLQNLEKIVSISAVVTFNKNVKTSDISGFVDVSKFGKEKRIKVIELDDYNKLNINQIKSLDFNLIIVNGWSRLIPKNLILMSKYGAIGVHAGHPPIGHGRAPVPWNIIYGFEDLEVYTFFLTENADDGDILKKKVVEISMFETAKTLYEKVTYVADLLIIQSLKNLESITPVKQNLNFSSFYKKRTKKDSLINFNQKVMTVYNFIRALSDPYPNAFTFLEKKKYYVKKSIPFDKFLFRNIQRNPGEIIQTFPSGLIVMTQDFPILLEEIYDKDIRVKTVWNDPKFRGKKFL